MYRKKPESISDCVNIRPAVSASPRSTNESPLRSTNNVPRAVDVLTVYVSILAGVSGSFVRNSNCVIVSRPPSVTIEPAFAVMTGANSGAISLAVKLTELLPSTLPKARSVSVPTTTRSNKFGRAKVVFPLPP